MKYTKGFKKISKKDISIAGGKGANLGEMVRAGFPIPPGFVILASAFEKFLENINPQIIAELDNLNYKDINALSKASNVIRDIIDDTEIPQNLKKIILKEFDKLGARYVAIRSSATAEDGQIASWAGGLESYLNISQSGLLESVKKCWASLFSPRAIFYRFDHFDRLSKKRKDRIPVKVAVVIQKMIQSEISGVCFTIHPISKSKNQMVIEAGWGLGEIIVGGKITPDTYVIDKEKWSIIDKNISEQKIMAVRSNKGTKETKVPKSKQEKQKLSDKQIIKLAKICKKIEDHYKLPQDIEWALEKNKLFILQSRPITTL